MKNGIFFITFFLLTITGNGVLSQTYADHFADSLEVKLILVDDDQRLLIFNQLSEHYARNHPKEALQRAQQGLRLSRQLNNRRSESRSMRNVGIALQYLLADYDSALNYCFDALRISEPEKFNEETILNFVTIANIYEEVGNFSKSIDYLTRAEILATAIKDYQQVTLIKISKSKSFLNIDLLNESIEELKSALKICKLHDLTLESASVRLAMAEYYLTVANEDLAAEHLNIALNILEKNGNHQELSRALIILSHFHSTFNRPLEAIDAIEKSIVLREYLGDIKGIAECLLFLGLNYNKNGEYLTALKYLSECRKVAEDVNAKRIIRRCYNQSYIAYSNLGDIQKATEFRDLYVSITELIFAEESERQIAEQQAKFDIEQKDNELRLQQERLDNKNLQFEKERRFNVALIIIALLLFGFGIIIFRSNREKKKVNQQLEIVNKQIARQNEDLKNLNDTKDKFFSIIGHDLKGPVNSLTSFLNLLKNHSSKLSEEEIKNLASDLDISIKNLHSLLENLLTWARTQTNNIELKAENLNMGKLVSRSVQLLQHQAQNKDIEIKLAGNMESKAYADRNTIETVIRNLISNAIKFTHPHGVIEISVNEWKDVVEVKVKDNGVGMTQEVMDKLFKIGNKHTTPGTNKELGTGLGLVLCKEFIENNDGFIWVNSTVGEGSEFIFTLPKN